MKDLLFLNAQKPVKDDLIISKEVCSPLREAAWMDELADHPDKCFTEYILQGIQSGFQIGYDRHHYLMPTTSNLNVDNPQAVIEYLSREVVLGRMWKIHVSKWQCSLHTSPLELIPKKNKPGKWRPIVDLSSLIKGSVNGGISTELSLLSYTSVDHLAALIVSAGRGSSMVKADIKHPDDQHLLGMHWEGFLYVDKVLPFGLCSAPKFFSAVADALQWILHHKGICLCLHYLDDFILVASEQQVAVSQKDTLASVLSRLGVVPLEESKLEGSSTCLTFLVIAVDTVAPSKRKTK